MNTTLPAPRDLPPHRRAQIRDELQRTVTGGRRRVRYAPLITAVGACAALVAVVVVMASQPTPVPTAVPTTPTTPTAATPVIPGLSDGERAAIERGCATEARLEGPVRLYNLVTDAAGTFGLLYGPSDGLTCTIGGAVPYDPGFAGGRDMEWLPGTLAVDLTKASAGDAPGKDGYEVLAGRISDKVAKVTYTHDSQTITAVVANGTFVARIIHPGTWRDAGKWTPGIVRAYDAAGTLLATSGQRSECYVTPAGAPLDGAHDPRTCKPATHWPTER